MIIVSGLAKCIDMVGHETAFECGLKNIAVLACGLQHIHPPENKTLAAEILKMERWFPNFPLV
jgi:DNA processing protein